MIQFELKKFQELSLDELYELLALRQEVFVVEQNCAFLDADGFDDQALHLFATSPDAEICACLRLLPPGTAYAQPSIGRLVVALPYRSRGLAKTALEQGIAIQAQRYPNQPVGLLGQSYLTEFFQRLGFRSTGEEIMDDGIPHHWFTLKEPAKIGSSP